MRLLSAVAFVLAGAACVAVGVVDVRRGVSPPVDPVPPRVVFTLPTCDGLPARVDVTNVNEARYVLVGFNDDPASQIEPGGSVGFEFDSGEVQVMVDGRPHGHPYVYLPPSCLQLP
ncbi:hypothetical protein O7626_39660 [Micromonospora sp. WMMD1102]|uniref:hypothetical protein n=1 Tax=Micromonospora sp. WMMD1102 TaxID=3016105 RepID=UPI002414E2E4|nr:hypothetical protein [Micromonospora sp. WMMD1102]MDG4791932.1 hypothetical protein [Micromonospora sp. WMMD1102]